MYRSVSNHNFLALFVLLLRTNGVMCEINERNFIEIDFFFPGFADRLQAELTQRFPSSLIVQV